MLERCQEVSIHILLLLADLIFEHLALDDRIVLFGVCGGNFLAVDAEFEDVDRAVVALSNLSQWAKLAWDCLLYTSDAADDSTRVFMGGGRII